MSGVTSISSGGPASIQAYRNLGGTRGETPVSAPEEQAAPAPQILFNPRIRFDSAAKVIVTEFRDLSSGDVQRTFPSKQQLQAYARAQELPQNAASSDDTQPSTGRQPAAAAGTVSENGRPGQAASAGASPAVTSDAQPPRPPPSDTGRTGSSGGLARGGLFA